MTNRITITISGQTGSGKSCLASHIAASLKALGLGVEVRDEDGDLPAPADATERLATMACEPDNRPQVWIETNQIARSTEFKPERCCGVVQAGCREYDCNERVGCGKLGCPSVGV